MKRFIFSKCALMALLGYLGAGHAQQAPVEAHGARVWVVNGLHAERVTGVAISGRTSGDAWLRVWRLSDPSAAGLECCWHVAGPDETGLREPLSPEVGDWKNANRLTPSHGASDQPFVGIGLSGGDVSVRRRGAQTLEVAWRQTGDTATVRHCVAQEGMRIQIDQADGSKTYYIPLGMDVEAPPRDRCAPEQ